MRIGLVCPYSFDVPGGVQAHVLGLARELRVRGHEVSVLAPGEIPDPHGHTIGRAVPLPYKGAVGRVSFGPAVAAKVGRWLHEGDFDVLHVHEPLTPSASLLAVRAAACPVVATFHTAQERPRALAASANLLRPWIGRIDAHIAVSDTAARTVRQYLPVQPRVIPNGLDLTPYDGERERDGRTVLFLGRIDERRKGLAELLAAWPDVTALRPDARLLVAGPGRRPAAPDGVSFLGSVDEPTKARLLRDADVVVAPNTHGESFGYVLVEAMASRTTVVARDLPAFTDVLAGGRFGTLFHGDELAERLLEVLADAAGRERVAARAARAVRQFSWPQVAPLVEQVYADLVARREAAAG